MCAKAYSKSDHCVDLLEASEHRNVMMHFEEGIFGGLADFHGLDRVFVHSFFQHQSIVDLNGDNWLS